MWSCIWMITFISAALTGFLVRDKNWVCACLSALLLIASIIAMWAYQNERRAAIRLLEQFRQKVTLTPSRPSAVSIKTPIN